MPAPDPLLPLRHLTARDRTLLSWLAEHYVLTTEQIAQALFPSLRAAQLRLTLLHRIGALDRFAFARTGEPGSGLWRYTLGPLGARLHRDAWHDPDNPAARPARTHIERRTRIAGSPRLGHLLGVNGFFTALVGHARTCDDAQLTTWWSEQHATAVFASRSPKLRPDGYGIWTHHDRDVEFFLEYDTGTEPVGRVVGKLVAYERLAEQTGTARALLLYVPDSRRRERLLADIAGAPLLTPVAVAAHTPAPHEPVWYLPGRPDPLPLHLLPTGDPAD
ncbi:hypothetical protein GCM10010123_19800 [Pilimelia anulata]|uniref:Protein involved in plasmid replication-relaxation n=1 Tax=Pilimelia anulata TaxID=53371 RepID=A0A8J3B4X6_9ACTN|nr:replication-relaxation family protein [Pilimelia anulata]GGJ90004.1 hypothetical protein GCM10010123_19800 [Pilimelia anulata]